MEVQNLTKNRDGCEFKSNSFKNEVKEEPLKVIDIISTTLNDTLLNMKKMEIIL